MIPRHIHIAGVGGIVTSALAGELVHRGLRVTGSDEYILPPADQILAECGLKVEDGYAASQVAGTVDLAVVGAALKPGNPVVDEILRREVRNISWPRLLSELGLLAPHNGIVTGTNGKTTTSCMWAWIMEQVRGPTDRVIGGRIADWPSGVRLRGAEYCVLEGDEYPSGWGDPKPKFFHYQPEIAVLLNIHFDHSDAFRDEVEVLSCYKLLADLLPRDGLLLFNGDDARCEEVASAVRCKTVAFGMNNRCPAPLANMKHERNGTVFSLGGVTFSLPLWGEMNARNAAAAALAAEFWGVPLAASAEALGRFPGAQGRQKRIRVDDHFVLLSDTAYHPEAVACLVEALRVHFPQRAVGLVLQPRHTLGPANWQQEWWPQALQHLSKLVVLDSVNHASEADNLFSSAALCREMCRRGFTAHHATEASDASRLFEELAAPGDVWVLCLENWFAQPLNEIVDHVLKLNP